MCCFGTCVGLQKLWSKGSNIANDLVKVSTPVLEFHPISEKERLFAKKLLLVVSHPSEAPSSLSSKQISDSITDVSPRRIPRYMDD